MKKILQGLCIVLTVILLVSVAACQVAEEKQYYTLTVSGGTIQGYNETTAEIEAGTEVTVVADVPSGGEVVFFSLV